MTNAITSRANGAAEGTVSRETRTIKLKYDTLADMLVSNLYALGVIGQNTDVVMVDFPIPVDDDDMVEIDLELVHS